MPIPPPPPSPSPSQTVPSWRQKRDRQAKAERDENIRLHNLNNQHWSRYRNKNGLIQWSTIDSLDDIRFRIACLLATGNIKPREILVSFDFDGTLGGRRTHKTQWVPKNDPSAIEDTHNEEEKSVQLLTELNRQKIPFFINTAAPNPCRAQETMQQTGMPESVVMNSYINKAAQIEHFGFRVKRCGHVFSAEYDKHVPIDYIIHTYSLPTKVIIHVDDGLVNIRTIVAADFKQNFIGMYFPTVEGTIIGSEPNVDESLEYLLSQSTIAEPLQVDACDDSTGSYIHPKFRSKAEADRYQRATGTRFRKGERVVVRYKGKTYDTWQW